MLTKEEVQALIVCRMLAARGETANYMLNHISGQIRALVGVLCEKAPPYNDYIPDLLEMADIPYIDHCNGDIGFDAKWLSSRGFDLTDLNNPTHPKFKPEEW